MTTPDATTQLADLEHKGAGAYQARLHDLLLAVASGSAARVNAAKDALLVTMEETMGLVDMMGRATILEQINVALNGNRPPKGGRRRLANVVGAFAAQGLHFALEAPPGQGLAKVTFQDALDNIVQRVPVTIKDEALRSAAEVARMYSNNPHIIAFVKSAEEAVTARVQALIAEGVRSGIGVREATDAIVRGVGATRETTERWTRAYAETVYRTNLNAAQSAGRFRQATSPVGQKVIAALRFTARKDSDVRDNHKAADGLVAAPQDKVWATLAPPLGYNCRCGVDLVSWPTAQRMGIVKSDGTIDRRGPRNGAAPDPGFRHKGRPDQAIYGGTPA